MQTACGSCNDKLKDMNRLNTIHDIIYGSLCPWRRDNLQKSDDYWKEKTLAREKRPLAYKSLFFSARLRCYQSLIDSDVDHFVEETGSKVKDTKSSNLSLLKMKDTRETVEGFAKTAIREQKMTGIAKEDILDTNADLFDRQADKETFIIMDYIVVALARCYFSIQTICGKALSDDRRLDLPTFCTSMLGRQRLSLLADIKEKDLSGDTKAVAEIKKSPTAKKIKDDTTPYTFNYKYEGAERAMRLNAVMQLLVAEGWIAADTTPDNFFNFFEGKSLHCNIKWTGRTATLCALLNQLTVQPFIEMKKGCTKALIAKNQFGKTFDYRGTTDEDKAKTVNTCIDLLNPKHNLPNPNAPTEDYDDNDMPFMKAQIREADFEVRKRGHWGRNAY